METEGYVVENESRIFLFYRGIIIDGSVKEVR